MTETTVQRTRRRTRNSNQPVFQGMTLKGVVRDSVFVGKVLHEYRNFLDKDIEARFTMYAPINSVVSGLKCLIGKDDEFELKDAMVVDEKKASEMYEDSISSGDSAVLVEQSGDLRDVFSVSVGNLRPNEKAYVSMGFTVNLEQEGDKISLVVPTTEIKKYGDPSDSGRRDDQEPIMSGHAINPLEVDIRVEGKLANGKISSPNCDLDVKKVRSDKKETVVQVSVSKYSVMNRDFVLEISPSADDNKSYILCDEVDDNNYVMARMFIDKSKASLSPATVKILVDNSGSMSGGDIALARDFLQTFFKQLGLTDHCTMSMFGSDVAHIREAPVAGNPAGKRIMGDFANKQDARMGGTRLAEAVKSVAELPSGEGMRDILIITDGAIHGYDVRGVIEYASKTKHRCFIVGVGNADHNNLKKICEATEGKYYSYYGQNIDEISKKVYESMRDAKASDINVNWPGKPSWTISPKNIWGNQSVDCFAQYEGALPDDDVILSLTKNGERIEHKLSLNSAYLFPGIAELARGRHIEDLIANGNEDEAKKKSLEWQIFGRGTSYVFQKARLAEDKASSTPESIVVDNMTPEGSFNAPSILLQDIHHDRAMFAKKENSTETVHIKDNSVEIQSRGIKGSQQTGRRGGQGHVQHRIGQADYGYHSQNPYSFDDGWDNFAPSNYRLGARPPSNPDDRRANFAPSNYRARGLEPKIIRKGFSLYDGNQCIVGFEKTMFNLFIEFISYSICKLGKTKSRELFENFSILEERLSGNLQHDVDIALNNREKMVCSWVFRYGPSAVKNSDAKKLYGNRVLKEEFYRVVTAFGLDYDLSLCKSILSITTEELADFLSDRRWLEFLDSLKNEQVSGLRWFRRPHDLRRLIRLILAGKDDIITDLIDIMIYAIQQNPKIRHMLRVHFRLDKVIWGKLNINKVRNKYIF